MDDFLTVPNEVGISAKLTGPEVYETVEFCFQFDEDEPKAFAWSGNGSVIDKKLHITIENRKDGNIVFNDGKGKTFKIFARKKEEPQ